MCLFFFLQILSGYNAQDFGPSLIKKSGVSFSKIFFSKANIVRWKKINGIHSNACVVYADIFCLSEKG